MKRANEVGPDPCRAEGLCSWYEKCRDEHVCCHSFRCYVIGKPQIGTDHEELKKAKGYRFVADRMQDMMTLPEFLEEPPTNSEGEFDGKF